MIFPFLLQIKFTDKISSSSEHLNLTLYGGFNGLFNGYDKFLILFLGNFQLLGIYSYMFSIANIGSVITEGVKKVLQPKMYHSLNKWNSYRGGITKTLKILLPSLFIINVILPFIIFELLKLLDLINSDFIFEDSFKFLIILVFGTSIWSLYHFINPYFIFFKKTNILIYIQFLSILIGVILIIYLSSLNVINFGIMRTLTSVLIVLFSFLFLIKKYHKNEKI